METAACKKMTSRPMARHHPPTLLVQPVADNNADVDAARFYHQVSQRLAVANNCVAVENSVQVRLLGRRLCSPMEALVHILPPAAAPTRCRPQRSVSLLRGLIICRQSTKTVRERLRTESGDDRELPKGCDKAQPMSVKSPRYSRDRTGPRHHTASSRSYKEERGCTDGREVAECDHIGHRGHRPQRFVADLADTFEFASTKFRIGRMSALMNVSLVNINNAYGAHHTFEYMYSIAQLLYTVQ